MKQRLVLFLLVTGTIQAHALPTHTKINYADIEALSVNRSQYNYEGIVKLSNCSGAIIRFENSKPADKAIVLTNGHCYSSSPFGGMMKPGEFVHRKSAKRAFKLLSKEGELTNHTVESTQVLYATMTGTDVSLYELSISYAELKSKFNTEAILLEREHPVVNEPIQILSGYFQIGYACQIDSFVFKLEEAGYTMTDSIRYSKEGCKTIHGTSGSPILSARTHRVVGINNTGNDSGERCTMDNPCEVSASGDVFFQKGLSYGQQTYQIYSCLNANNQLDLSLADCKLHQRKQQALLD